jgi:hypothetical protein
MQNAKPLTKKLRYYLHKIKAYREDIVILSLYSKQKNHDDDRESV